MEEKYFVKLVSPIGDAVFIKDIPCLLGSENHLVIKLHKA